MCLVNAVPGQVGFSTNISDFRTTRSCQDLSRSGRLSPQKLLERRQFDGDCIRASLNASSCASVRRASSFSSAVSGVATIA